MRIMVNNNAVVQAGLVFMIGLSLIPLKMGQDQTGASPACTDNPDYSGLPEIKLHCWTTRATVSGSYNDLMGCLESNGTLDIQKCEPDYRNGNGPRSCNGQDLQNWQNEIYQSFHGLRRDCVIFRRIVRDIICKENLEYVEIEYICRPNRKTITIATSTIAPGPSTSRPTTSLLLSSSSSSPDKQQTTQTNDDVAMTLASPDEKDNRTVNIAVGGSLTVVALATVVVIATICTKRRKAKNDTTNDLSGVSTDTQSARPLPVTPNAENIYVSTNAAGHYSTLGDPDIVTSHNVNNQYSLAGDPGTRGPDYSLAGDPDKDTPRKRTDRYSLARNPDDTDQELDVQEHVTVIVDNQNYAPGPTETKPAESEVNTDDKVRPNLDAGWNNEVDVDTEIWDNPDYEGPQKVSPNDKSLMDKNDNDLNDEDVDTELCDNPDYQSSSQAYPER